MQDASGRLDPTGIPVAFALTPAIAGRHVVHVNYTTRELTAKLDLDRDYLAKRLADNGRTGVVEP